MSSEEHEGLPNFVDYFDEEELQAQEKEVKAGLEEYDHTKPVELSEEEKGYSIPTVEFNWFEEMTGISPDSANREYVKRRRAHAQLMSVQGKWKEALETAEELLDMESKATDETGFVLTRAEHNEMSEIASVAKRRLEKVEAGPRENTKLTGSSSPPSQDDQNEV